MILYLFGTLFAPNGDAAIGAWFLQNKVIQCPDGTFGVQVGANCVQSTHVDGDLLIQADTTNGGSVVNMRIFSWVGNSAFPGVDCAALAGTLVPPKDNLCQLAELLDATCGNTPNDNACGTMNLVATESPDTWGFLSKFPPAAGAAEPPFTNGIDVGDFPETSFFEAGINVTALLPTAQCFSSFLMNTRSSQRIRAQLKDKALGAFELCSALAVTEVHVDTGTPHTDITGLTVFVGDTVHDQIEITGNIAAGDPPDPTGTVDFTLYDGGDCGVTGTGAIASALGVPIVFDGTDDGFHEIDNALSHLVVAGDVAFLSYEAVYSGERNYAGPITAACEPFEVKQPFLKIEKVCTNLCATETATFTVKLDGVAFGSPLTCGTNTGFLAVAPGVDRVVAETAVSAGSRSDYATTIGNDCDSDGKVTLAANNMKTCTITNVRKATLKIIKELDPSGDSQKFDLLVGGVLATGATGTALDSIATMISGDGDDVGNNGMVTVRIDTAFGGTTFAGVSVGEEFGNGDPVTGFQPFITCDDFVGTNDDAASVNIPSFLPGEVVTCRIINIKPEAGLCTL